MTKEQAPIEVRISHYDMVKTGSAHNLQFVTRQMLKQQGIPIGHWGTDSVTSGTLEVFDDNVSGDRVIRWWS